MARQRAGDRLGARTIDRTGQRHLAALHLHVDGLLLEPWIDRHRELDGGGDLSFVGRDEGQDPHVAVPRPPVDLDIVGRHVLDAHDPRLRSGALALGHRPHAAAEADPTRDHLDIEASFVDQRVPAQRALDVGLHLQIRPIRDDREREGVDDVADPDRRLRDVPGLRLLLPALHRALEGGDPVVDGDLDLVGVGCGIPGQPLDDGPPDLLVGALGGIHDDLVAHDPHSPDDPGDPGRPVPGEQVRDGAAELDHPGGGADLEARARDGAVGQDPALDDARDVRVAQDVVCVGRSGRFRGFGGRLALGGKRRATLGNTRGQGRGAQAPREDHDTARHLDISIRQRRLAPRHRHGAASPRDAAHCCSLYMRQSNNCKYETSAGGRLLLEEIAVAIEIPLRLRLLREIGVRGQIHRGLVGRGRGLALARAGRGLGHGDPVDGLHSAGPIRRRNAP